MGGISITGYSLDFRHWYFRRRGRDQNKKERDQSERTERPFDITSEFPRVVAFKKYHLSEISRIPTNRIHKP